MVDYTAEQYRAAAKKALAAGDVKSANELIAAGMALSKSATSLPEQVGSGTSEGIAGALGTPVDLMTSVINGLVQKPQYEDAGSTLETGLKLRPTGAGPAISEPFGGGSTFQKLMSPFISDVPPQTTAQRYGRRIGQEVGADAVFGPAAMLAPAIGTAARANLPAYAATNLASDVGAGVAGQTAREVAPESDAADFWASLLGGGGAGALASRAMPEYGPVPTREQNGVLANDKWAAVKADPQTLTDAATARLTGDVKAALPTGQLAPDAYPNAFRMAGKMDGLQNPTVYDVEELRRLFGDAVASNPQESRVGVGMKKATEDYLKRIAPSDLNQPYGPPNPNARAPADVVGDLSAARELSARNFRYDAIANKEMRGESRAATTGTGGNEVNAIRQNVRTIYDKEMDPTLRGQRQGFTPAEMDQMKKVVFGTGPQNIARLAGRMAPTSGALPMMATGYGGMAGILASGAGAGPMAAIPALAGGVGFLGKALAENMTQKEIQKLLDIIASGGALKPSSARQASQAAVLQQLLSSSLSGVPQ